MRDDKFRLTKLILYTILKKIFKIIIYISDKISDILLLASPSP